LFRRCLHFMLWHLRSYVFVLDCRCVVRFGLWFRLAYTTRLQEDLKVELHRADGVRQLELLQHTWVQDTEDTNGVVLTAKVDLNGR
jgi:hypothetical protein